MNATERTPERRDDVFDDILARIEVLRASTSARISQLNVALDAGPAEEPVPVAPVREDARPSALPEPEPAPTPAAAAPTERRVVVIDDLSRAAAPSNVSAAALAPVAAVRPRPRITLPTIRIPRPTLAVPRPVLAVVGGVVVLFVVAGLTPTPDSETASEAPLIIEFVPDPSTAIAPVVPPPTPEPEPVEEVRSVPLAVRIPAIQVDATTVPVGLEVDGSMEIPSDVATIGWYEPAQGLGVRPGQTGTAVLAGHVDSRTQGAGAFYALRDLAVGDRIEIVHEDGTTSVWWITQVTQYPKNEIPLEDVFVWSGPPRLALITCGGAFDWTARSYTDNLVVYAEPDTTAAPIA